MRSQKITLAIPHRLMDAYTQHAPEVGYADTRQMLTWCPFYSLLVRKPHIITAPIAQAPITVQDEFIKHVVDSYERGEATRSSYFEHVIADVVQRFGIDARPEVIRAVVADAVRNRPLDESKKAP